MRRASQPISENFIKCMLPFSNIFTDNQPIVIELPPPTDLEITSIQIPSSIKSGELIQIQWTVTNASTQLIAIDAATSIIRSTDGGVSWQQGSPLAVVSLASVDHEVWATTHDGVMYSTDRGAINSSHLKVLTG